MPKGVVLTTPNTLIAGLRPLRSSWQQETLAESAREVQKLGAELYDRLRAMTGHMEAFQRSLSSRVEAYNKAVGSLESRGLVSARRFPVSGSWVARPRRSASWPRRGSSAASPGRRATTRTRAWDRPS